MMARRGRQDEALILLLAVIAVVVVIVIVASILVPVVLAGAFVHYHMKRRKEYSQLSGTVSDFWLRRSEKAKFVQTVTILAESQQAVDAAHRQGENAGLDRNLDGRFSARSKLGKQIRRLEERNEDVIAEHYSDFEYLRDLPMTRWSEFRDTIAREKASLISLCAWAASAVVFVGGTLLSTPFARLATGDTVKTLYGPAFICALIAAAVFFAACAYAK